MGNAQVGQGGWVDPVDQVGQVDALGLWKRNMYVDYVGKKNTNKSHMNSYTHGLEVRMRDQFSNCFMFKH